MKCRCRTRRPDADVALYYCSPCRCRYLCVSCITNAQSATPVNNKTLKAAGSNAIGISNAVLAGGVGNPTLLRPISGAIELVTATANATAIAGSISVEDLAGSIIVPPGGYLAVANGVSNAVSGHLVVAGFTWDEVPV